MAKTIHYIYIYMYVCPLQVFLTFTCIPLLHVCLTTTSIPNLCMHASSTCMSAHYKYSWPLSVCLFYMYVCPLLAINMSALLIFFQYSAVEYYITIAHTGCDNKCAKFKNSLILQLSTTCLKTSWEILSTNGYGRLFHILILSGKKEYL